MNDGKSYAQPQAAGHGDGWRHRGRGGRVANPAYAVGDKVVGMGGWQQYSWSTPHAGRAAQGRHHARAAVGLPGRGGHARRHGLGGAGHIIEPKAGETVVVSAASGAVGSMVGPAGQGPRLPRAVGIAGGPTSAPTWWTSSASTPASTTRRTATSSRCRGAEGGLPERHRRLLRERRRHGPRRVLMRMNAFGRIALCGMIAGYNGEPMPWPIRS
jgi:NADPH-dependent curcumin reductase CurA